MSILAQARASGACPPSLLSQDLISDSDEFAAGLLRILDASNFQLSPSADLVDNLKTVLEKASSIDNVPASVSDRKAYLEQQRCIILAVVARTRSDSRSLVRILAAGYLAHVKIWLDDILGEKVGTVDLLLHLLSSIEDLPVSKADVKDSGMGKTIGSIEKHKLCVGTPNEGPITERVSRVKAAWQKSVKAMKGEKKPVEKRGRDDVASQAEVKRAKVEVDASKKSAPSTFSSLMKRVSGPKKSSSLDEKPSSTEKAEESSEEKATNGTKGSSKKSSLRVKWADHFGGSLEESHDIDTDEVAPKESSGSSTDLSWSDRKRRDRMREKELLSKVKKAKLLDEEDEEVGPSISVQTTMAWKEPGLVIGLNLPQLVSQEVDTQNDRMKSLPGATYATEYDVPPRPAPLNEIEQALDMTAQSSASIASIPFFAPQQQPIPVAAQIPAAPSIDASTGTNAIGQPSSGATMEYVQSLGLPLFLVGYDPKALETIANSPGLLANLVDANGMYDQQRVLTLVHTLSATSNPMPSSSYAPAPVMQAPAYGSGPAAASFGQASGFSMPPAPFGQSRSAEGNLHVSGYGPTTTQTDIINHFAPYVQVEEVVMKGTFCFVNTSDPTNAAIAKEHLNGSLLGGLPIRINAAQRKSRDAPQNSFGKPAQSHYGHNPDPTSQSYGGPPAPRSAPDINSVRDDRGNPATKNLFVAGYGLTTTEQELRHVFGQQCTVIGVVKKGSFSFVNTETREQAVLARDALGGTILNGGALRINFAKETGRLGTSFDLTYHESSARSARNPPPQPPASMSYYGRGF